MQTTMQATGSMQALTASSSLEHNVFWKTLACVLCYPAASCKPVHETAEYDHVVEKRSMLTAGLFFGEHDSTVVIGMLTVMCC